MHTAAYCSYWTANRFLFVNAEMSGSVALASQKNLKHIQVFYLAISSQYNLRLAFEDSKWTTWLLAADGEDLSFHSAQKWNDAHRLVQDVVTGYIASLGIGDPCVGRGLTRLEVTIISRIQPIKNVVRILEFARAVLERERQRERTIQALREVLNGNADRGWESA